MSGRKRNYLDVTPYREALLEAIGDDLDRRLELARDIFGHHYGSTPRKRMADVLFQQSSISYDTATAIAAALGRRDLLPVTDDYVSDTVTLSRRSSAPNAPRGATVSELLAREQNAFDFLRVNDTIEPELVLAMVVWPPEHLET